MTKYPIKTFTIGVRFTQRERDALAKCAAADDRPLSVMLHKLAIDALRERGFFSPLVQTEKLEHMKAAALRNK